MTDNLQKDSFSDLSQEEQALRYRVLVDSMNDGFGIIDNDGMFTYVNARFATILGLKPKNMVGKRVNDFLDEKNRKIIRDNIRRRTEGQSTQYELEWTKSSGEQVPTIVSGAPLISIDNQIQGSFAVVTDITEIKQSREALEESAEMMRRIFEESQIGMELFDKDGILITANKAVLDIFGIPSIQQIIGFSLFDDPNVPNDIKAKLIRGEAVQYESEFDFAKVKEANLYETSRSGTIITDSFITPLGTDNNELHGYLCQIHEKTEHRRTEEALEDTEKRYQLLAENVTDVIFTSDLELNLTYVSTSVDLLLGYTSVDLDDLTTGDSGIMVNVESITITMKRIIEYVHPFHYEERERMSARIKLKYQNTTIAKNVEGREWSRPTYVDIIMSSCYNAG